MGLRRTKRKTGADLFGFFAGNDAQLSTYLNSLSAGERTTLITTLDAVLDTPTRDLFEERLAHFWLQYQDAPSGSEAGERLAAIGRMLGYEYERAFKGSMAELTERFTRVYVSSGLADDDQNDQYDVFGGAAGILTAICTTNDDVQDQDKKLCPSCLAAAALAAGLLAHAGNPTGASTEDYVTAILADEDQDAAGRVVYALAWYFALTFLGPNIGKVPRDGWLEAMQEGLGPVESIQIAESDQLVELFESYKSWTKKKSEAFPIMLCRWLNLHLGDKWSDTPDIASAMIVMKACQEVRPAFVESLVDAGLLSR